MAKEVLCSSCSSSIWCPTWTQWKCTAKSKRIHNPDSIAKCESYTKRPTNWTEVKCRCKDCQVNDSLWDDEGDE